MYIQVNFLQKKQYDIGINQIKYLYVTHVFTGEKISFVLRKWNKLSKK